jgi:serine/threonine protein phosphatase PrpC
MEIMPFQIESFGISDIGLIRSNNEDVWGEISEYSFYALADGMGGHQAGEVAAKEAVTSVCQAMEAYLSKSTPPVSNEELILNLKEAILEANSWVYRLSQETDELAGMGTTLCCFFLYQDKLIFGNVEDSRIYLFREKLTQLSEDHSLRREIINRFQIDEKKAHNLPSKNVITRAIGTSSYVQPDVEIATAISGDIYFLCSDGLTDTVTDAEISSIISKAPSIKQACQALVEAAKAKGGIDNITIVMIKII